MIALIVAAALVAAALFILVTVVRNTYVCSPNEVLTLLRAHLPAARGRGQAGRLPGRARRPCHARAIIEVVDKMALTNMPIELAVTNAFSKGGVPLNVVAVANIKIPARSRSCTTRSNASSATPRSRSSSSRATRSRATCAVSSPR